MATKKKTAAASAPSEFMPVAGRQTFRIDPRAIKIPGVDSPFNAADPLCDERARKAADHVAPFYDPEFVRALKAGEVELPPIVVTVDGKGELIKVDGGRRLIHAREAGLKDIEYVVTENTNPALLFMAVKRANIGRVNDSAIVQARDADRARTEFGLTLKEFAPCTSLTEEVLRQRLSLLFLCPELQALTELPEGADGNLPFSIAIQLAKLKKPAKPAAETADAKAERFAFQLATYKGLLAAGNLTTASVRREKKGKPADAAEGADGAENEGADGADGTGTTEGRKGKKRGEAHAEALTLAEMRKLLKGNAEKTAGFMGLTKATLAVLRAVTGAAKASTVAGLEEALNTLRGVTPPAAPDAPANDAAEATTEAEAPAAE